MLSSKVVFRFSEFPNSSLPSGYVASVCLVLPLFVIGDENLIFLSRVLLVQTSSPFLLLSIVRECLPRA